MIDEKSPKDAYQEHLDAARNANAGSAITIWTDGNWKRWNELDAKYAEKDPDWLLTIPLSEVEAPSPEQAAHRTMQELHDAMEPREAHGLTEAERRVADILGKFIDTLPDQAPSPQSEYIQRGDFLYMSSGDVYKLCRSAEAPSPVRAEISEEKALYLIANAIERWMRGDGVIAERLNAEWAAKAAFRALQSIATITEKE